MSISKHTINAIADILICRSIGDIKAATEKDAKLQMLKGYIIRGLPHTKEAVEQGVEKYWPIRNELTTIDGIAVKGKHIIIPYPLQRQFLVQLHNNYMGIEKTCLTSVSVLDQHECCH